jgi:hypothetical protein
MVVFPAKKDLQFSYLKKGLGSSKDFQFIFRPEAPRPWDKSRKPLAYSWPP